MTWFDQALHVLRELSETRPTVTADDLIAIVGPPDPDHEPNGAASAVGSVFNTAQRQGWLIPTREVVRSTQKHRKGGAIRVWTRNLNQPERLL